MVRSLFVTISAVVVSALSFGLDCAWSAASGKEPLIGLAGRWAGNGTLIPAVGPSETFKCVITYFPSQDGSRIRQNLRCRGVSYKFDAATHLQIQGAQVTGQWTDNVYSLTGTVSGTLTDKGFDILLSGRYFVARMTVVSSTCEQSVTVVPVEKTEMKELAAMLKKC